MFIEPQNLKAIAVCQIRVAANDEIVFIIAVAGGHAEIVAAAEHHGVVGGEIHDDSLGMHQQIAALPAQTFFHPAFQPAFQQGWSCEFCGAIRVKPVMRLAVF